MRAAATAAPLPCSVRGAARRVFEGEAWQVIVAVTGAFGGGSEVGAADPQDGVLDVAVLPAGSRIGLARRAWGLKRGTIADQHDVEHHRGTLIEVDLPPGTEFNADGEVREHGMERMTLEHAALRLVVPPKACQPRSVRRGGASAATTRRPAAARWSAACRP